MARRGARNGPARDGNSHFVGWRDDALIRERMQVVWDLWRQGFTVAESVDRVAAWGATKNVKTSYGTIRDDRKRILQLIDEADEDLRTRQLTSIEYAKKRMYEELDANTVAPMARGQFWRNILAADELSAKIGGTMITQIKGDVQVSTESIMKVLVGVLVKELGSEEKALHILDAVQLAIAPPKETARDTV